LQKLGGASGGTKNRKLVTSLVKTRRKPVQTKSKKLLLEMGEETQNQKGEGRTNRKVGARCWQTKAMNEIQYKRRHRSSRTTSGRIRVMARGGNNGEGSGSDGTKKNF